jgi:BirA family transcriptional regulator, biotin operon repressor / biotin---[acetyl-CoA-carboxylase] ligase
MHVRLGGADRQAGPARDLFVGKVEGVAEDDDGPLVGGETRERVGQVVSEIAEQREAGGIRFLVCRALVGDEQFGGADALARVLVPAGVYDEPVQPGRELRVTAELANLRAELDKRLLGRVSGVLEVAHELGGKPVDPRPVALDKRVERGCIARPRLGCKCEVGQLPVRKQTGVGHGLLGETRRKAGRLHEAVSLVRPTMADSLAPDRVEPLLAGGFGRPYLYRPSCDSTQALLDGDHPEGTVAACDEQTAGRGRLGRGWTAPPGSSVLMSILLRPPAGRSLPELSLVGGVATALTVERATGLSAQIKWPNDVMLNRGKVAGVLAEAKDDAVVLGIGLNVNQTREQLPAEAKVPAASLRTVDAAVRDRAAVLADLVLEIERVYKRWGAGGLDAIYDELGSRDFLRGRRVLVDGTEGLAAGIGRDGRLEIAVDGGTRRVESGDVSYVR